jgi:hypothetical protein
MGKASAVVVVAGLLSASGRLGLAAAPGLSLAVYNNTALASEPIEQRTVPGFSFEVPLRAAQAMSAELTGTMTVQAGAKYSFNCSFGAAHFGALHVDDHLVCQHGANVDVILTPGQKGGKGCGGGGGHHTCSGIDNPLPIMSRKELPVRLQVLHNPALRGPASSSSLLVVDVNVSSVPVISAEPQAGFELAPELPSLERQRRTMQRGLLQGWGLFYDMSYLDAVLLPHGSRLKLALCETQSEGGQCLSSESHSTLTRLGCEPVLMRLSLAHGLLARCKNGLA